MPFNKTAHCYELSIPCLPKRSTELTGTGVAAVWPRIHSGLHRQCVNPLLMGFRSPCRWCSCRAYLGQRSSIACARRSALARRLYTCSQPPTSMPRCGTARFVRLVVQCSALRQSDPIRSAPIGACADERCQCTLLESLYGDYSRTHRIAFRQQTPQSVSRPCRLCD